jgi:hypothetical protein
MNEGSQSPRQSSESGLERMLSKKLKIVTDVNNHKELRRFAIKALKSKNSRSMEDRVAETVALEETEQRLGDLERIEQQYTKYFVHQGWDKRPDENTTFGKYIQGLPISPSTKGRLILKSKTPFRLPLEDFSNKQLNVEKYNLLIGHSNIVNDVPTAVSSSNKSFRVKKMYKSRDESSTPKNKGVNIFDQLIQKLQEQKSKTQQHQSESNEKPSSPAKPSTHVNIPEREEFMMKTRSLLQRCTDGRDRPLPRYMQSCSSRGEPLHSSPHRIQPDEPQ